MFLAHGLTLDMRLFTIVNWPFLLFLSLGFTMFLPTFSIIFLTQNCPVLVCVFGYTLGELLIPGQRRIDSFFEVIVKTSIQTLESRLPASLHIDVQTGCPNTPSEA